MMRWFVGEVFVITPLDHQKPNEAFQAQAFRVHQTHKDGDDVTIQLLRGPTISMGKLRLKNDHDFGDHVKWGKTHHFLETPKHVDFGFFFHGDFREEFLDPLLPNRNPFSGNKKNCPNSRSCGLRKSFHCAITGSAGRLCSSLAVEIKF